MKKLFILLAACAAIASCDIVTSDNGDLDGFWQMTGVDTLSTGNHAETKENRVFWAVQANLLRTMSDSYNVLFRFEHTADSLTLHDPYIDKRDSSDIKVEDVSLLTPFGVNNLREGYSVLELSGSSMILQSETLRLYFRKY